MLKVSSESSDTLYRISLIEKGLSLYSHVKYQDLFKHVMTMPSDDLALFEKCLTKKRSVFLVNRRTKNLEPDLTY